LGLIFAVEPANVDEGIEPSLNARDAVVRLAKAKATAAAALFPKSIVIAADTLVSLDDRPLGKPANADEARAMLVALCGRSHQVVTGVAIAGGRNPRAALHTSLAETAVEMRRYTEREIEQTIALGTPFDKAGSYGIQDTDFAPVGSIRGCYCNVVGLPLWTAWELLRSAGIAAPVTPDEAIERCVICPLRRVTN
jgi:MAF protein